MKSVCLISIILILLSACVKKPTEEIPESTAGNENNVIDNENYTNKKDELMTLIKKVIFTGAPDQWIYGILKEQEAFLELEKHSDELLDYALDLYQDEALTIYDQIILGYALQSTEFERFKYFLRDLAVLYVEEGKISSDIAGFSFYPGNNHRVSENIKDPVIREAFETVLKSNRGWPHAETKAGIIDNLIATQSEGSTNNYHAEPREPWQRYDLNGGNLIIHDGVTFIRLYEFRNKQLTSVAFPDSVTFIRSHAFRNNQLTNVIIPNSVTSIEAYAFENNLLTSVIIPDSVYSIGGRAFANNPLTSIVIPESIGSLDEDIFAESLRNVTQITIGANVNLSGLSDVVWTEFCSFYIANGNRAGTYTLSNNGWSVQFR